MTGHEKTEARKIKILEAATKVFSEKGFQETTIAEIAKTASASEASVYDYFTTKENLLFSIPSGPVGKLHKALEYHLQLIRGSINKIHAALYMMLQFYQEHPEFASIMMLILKHNRKFIDTEGHKEIREYLKIVDRIIEEGMESNEFCSDISPYYVRGAIIGAMEHIVTNWLMIGVPKDLMDAFDPLFKIGVKLLKKAEEAPFCPWYQIQLTNKKQT